MVISNRIEYKNQNYEYTFFFFRYEISMFHFVAFPFQIDWFLYMVTRAPTFTTDFSVLEINDLVKHEFHIVSNRNMQKHVSLAYYCNIIIEYMLISIGLLEMLTISIAILCNSFG